MFNLFFYKYSTTYYNHPPKTSMYLNPKIPWFNILQGEGEHLKLSQLTLSIVTANKFR
jgi:hypothetical protein